MAKKEKKAVKKGKRIRKGRKHESVKVNKYYEIKGETLERTRKFCPRCGPGVWLSRHDKRLYCGKCGYTSFEGRKSQEEAKPENKVGEKAEEGKNEEKERAEKPEKQDEATPEEREKPGKGEG